MAEPVAVALQIEDEDVGFINSRKASVASVAAAREQGSAVRTTIAVLAGLSLGLLASLVAVSVRGGTWVRHEAPLNFLVVGDWGRQGMFNQSLIAKQMGIVADKLGIQFVISTGDNFYERGLKSLHDPLFKESFSDIYTASSLQTLWYAVLGNHDYRGDPKVQMDPKLRIQDRRWFCQRSYQLSRTLCSVDQAGDCTESVDFFFIDTNPFVPEYWAKGAGFDFSDFLPQEQQQQSQIMALSSLLGASNATWKIVVGHHPVYSLGEHGNTSELVRLLEPVLEEHQVDLYVNGHDHCMQHIKRDDGSVHYLVSGGGSKAFRTVFHPVPEDGFKYGFEGQGFAAVSMAPRAVHVAYYGVYGELLYSFHLAK
eukprot:SM000014S00306  [mRNA]  locus=s14:677708:680767:+ [translate_table: standard]